ncbi:MAG TPA: YkgJ family cysteine cluster protein, partial [Treponemataceae bacterium]|nr:YkgJ family cysteine cluster protein [Treponemataceae bacterium]
EIGTDPKKFTEQNLRQDPDGVGFLLKELPCPFQNADNTCSVYDVRTLSCKSFPHTESKNIQKKLVGLALDSLYCPAAFLICEKIIEKY